MAKEREYELIQHSVTKFHFFIVELLYRTPHIHKDFEVCLILKGTLTLKTASASYQLRENEIFLLNPFESHELLCETPAIILSMQIPLAFFSYYFPQIENIAFHQTCFAQDAAITGNLQELMLEISCAYFMEQDFYPLECAQGINRLFLTLLENTTYEYISEKDRKSNSIRGLRMRKIMKYIDQHYNEKILLSDIAEQENLDLYYLSHFFKENFGVNFQSYVSRIRCEHARQLLTFSDMSLLDISLGCGFSDSRYFNRAFKEQYGITPKLYRKQFHEADTASVTPSLLTSQNFLSRKQSLALIREQLQIV